jgi:hypothetical protein
MRARGVPLSESGGPRRADPKRASVPTGPRLRYRLSESFRVPSYFSAWLPTIDLNRHDRPHRQMTNMISAGGRSLSAATIRITLGAAERLAVRVRNISRGSPSYDHPPEAVARICRVSTASEFVGPPDALTLARKAVIADSARIHAKSFAKQRSSVQSSATRTFFSNRGSLLR